MVQRKLIKALMVPLILTVFLVAVSQVPAAQKSPAIENAIFGWQLTNAKVVNPGSTSKTDEGTLTTGYTVEATAVAQGIGAPVQRGTFRVTMSIFFPQQDMPGQKAGQWYLTGKWTITDAMADKKTLKIRHNQSVSKGTLKTSLSFNPAAQKGSLDAYVAIQMSPAGGRWTSAEGVFSGNERMEGFILLNGDKWPDLSGRAGR